MDGLSNQLPIDAIAANEPEKARAFVEEALGKDFAYVCVIGTTDTSLIPGITVAGASPELTTYTPPADVEYVLLGRCRCIPAVPVTPEGIPTPALITRASIKLSNAPALVAVGGLKVKPKTPYINLGGEHGGDIRTGRALPRETVSEVYERAKLLGRELSKACDFLVIGESIPAGTTTALAVMVAVGVDAWGKVSSAMPNNPHQLKSEVVREALRNAGIEPGSCADDPLAAVSSVGDPVIPAFVGLVAGASKEVLVIAAGGTQMGAVLSLLKGLEPDALENVAIGTTRWILEDSSSDLVGLVKQIGRVPILAAKLDFSQTSAEGLRYYERGFVKEGVGAGGSAIAAMLKSKGEISAKRIAYEVERDYASLITKGYAE